MEHGLDWSYKNQQAEIEIQNGPWMESHGIKIMDVKNTNLTHHGVYIYRAVCLTSAAIYPIHLPCMQGQRRQISWTYGTGKVNPSGPTACWVINNTSGKFSQKLEDKLMPGV